MRGAVRGVQKLLRATAFPRLTSLPKSDIPDSADVDVPPPGDLPVLTREKDPPYEQKVDFAKLTFAIVIVSVCLAAILIGTTAQYLLQNSLPDASAINTAIDWLKVVVTTGLGFIWGRSTIEGKKKKKA